jgi:ABC-type protease/lipase transport system fused ATPase/permease subunit
MLAARVADCVFALLAAKEEGYDGQVSTSETKPDNGKRQRAQYVA